MFKECFCHPQKQSQMILKDIVLRESHFNIGSVFIRFTEVFTELRSSRARNEFLEQIDKLIDWRPFQTLINKKLNKRAEAKGEPTYDGVLMFKILLLETWYNLSD